MASTKYGQGILALALAALLIGSIIVGSFTMAGIAYAQLALESNSTSSSITNNSTLANTNTTSSSSSSSSASTNIISTSSSSTGSDNSTINTTSTSIDSAVAIDHSPIEINNPVEWVQTVTLSNETAAVKVELPADAQILSVATSDGQTINSSAVVEDPTQVAATDADAVVTLNNVSQALQDNAQTKLVAIDQPADGYSISFETPAPYAIENQQIVGDLYQKNVTVTHDSAFHYTDVKSYSNIPEDLVSKGTQFKMYWMVNGTKTDVTAAPRFA